MLDQGVMSSAVGCKRAHETLAAMNGPRLSTILRGVRDRMGGRLRTIEASSYAELANAGGLALQPVRAHRGGGAAMKERPATIVRYRLLIDPGSGANLGNTVFVGLVRHEAPLACPRGRRRDPRATDAGRLCGLNMSWRVAGGTLLGTTVCPAGNPEARTPDGFGQASVEFRPVGDGTKIGMRPDATAKRGGR